MSQIETPSLASHELFQELGLEFAIARGWDLDSGILQAERMAAFLRKNDLLIGSGYSGIDLEALNIETADTCPSTTGTVYLFADQGLALKRLRRSQHPVYGFNYEERWFSVTGEAYLGKRAESDGVDPIYHGVAAVEFTEAGQMRLADPNNLNPNIEPVILMRMIDTRSNLASLILTGDVDELDSLVDQMMVFRKKTEIPLPIQAVDFYGSLKFLRWLWAEGTPLDFFKFPPDDERFIDYYKTAYPHIFDFIRRADWALKHDDDLIEEVKNQSGYGDVTLRWGDEKPKNLFIEPDFQGNRTLVAIDPIWLVFLSHIMQEVPGSHHWQGPQLCCWPIQRHIQAQAYPRTLATVLSDKSFLDSLDRAYEKHFKGELKGDTKRLLDFFTAYYQIVESTIRLCWPSEQNNPSEIDRYWLDLVRSQYPKMAGQLVAEAIPDCPDDYCPELLKQYER